MSKTKGFQFPLNKGIKAARGSWIARMDADDEALPERLEKQVDYIYKHPDVDILGSAIITRTKEGVITGKIVLPSNHEKIIKRAFKKTLVFHPTILIRKEVYENIGNYNETLRWLKMRTCGIEFTTG